MQDLRNSLTIDRKSSAMPNETRLCTRGSLTYFSCSFLSLVKEVTGMSFGLVTVCIPGILLTCFAKGARVLFSHPETTISSAGLDRNTPTIRSLASVLAFTGFSAVEMTEPMTKPPSESTKIVWL